MNEPSQSFFFSSEKLIKLAEDCRESYCNAYPFPHYYFDDFLPANVVTGLAADFPGPDEANWIKRSPTHRYQQMKLKIYDESKMPFTIRHMLGQFNSSSFLAFLETLTGIDGLISDPYWWGGGLHEIEKGGYLRIHIDFNRHEKLRLDRRLNVILYLNEDWEEVYGGQLELWNKDVSVCEVKLLPILNRLVVFSTSEYSWHGHPDPLRCPDDRTRKSLALYYYTNGRPEMDQAHSTQYRLRPGEKIVNVVK